MLDSKNRFEIARDKAIQEEIKTRMESEQQDTKLLTSELRRAKLEQEIRDDSSSAESELLSLGVKIVLNEGLQFIEKEEYANLEQNIRKIGRNLDTCELNAEAVQAALTLPADCGQSILKIAVNKYLQGLINESLAVFHLLIVVNPGEADYWFRFGLAAQKCEKYSLALTAFTEASLLAPEFPGAHIFAAYCHLKMGEKEGVLDELALAKTTQLEEKWKEHIRDVELLLNPTN